MDFTGERYVPSLLTETRHEHLHRYALGRDFAANKVILDVASGEGYGCALMAQVAASVVGVDIDKDTVEHARREYAGHANLQFSVGACDALPLSNGCVDLVTSFETIEHHDRHDEMMCEIKRVLRPGGLLILSSPNRLLYSNGAAAQRVNPFHVKELDYEELSILLGRHFSHTRFYGQRVTFASFISGLRPATVSTESRLAVYLGNESGVSRDLRGFSSPLYFVALCSDEPLDAANLDRKIESVFAETEGDLLAVYRQTIQNVQNDADEGRAALQGHVRLLEDQADRLIRRGAELEEHALVLTRHIESVEAENARLEQQNARLEQQVDDLQPQAQELARVLESRAWKMVLRLRRLRGMLTPLPGSRGGRP